MKYAVAVLLGAASAYQTEATRLGHTVKEINDALQKASVAYLDLHTYFEDAIADAKHDEIRADSWAHANNVYDNMWKTPNEAMAAVEKIKYEMTHSMDAPLAHVVHGLEREQYWLEKRTQEKLDEYNRIAMIDNQLEDKLERDQQVEEETLYNIKQMEDYKKQWYNEIGRAEEQLNDAFKSPYVHQHHHEHHNNHHHATPVVHHVKPVVHHATPVIHHVKPIIHHTVPVVTPVVHHTPVIHHTITPTPVVHHKPVIHHTVTPAVVPTTKVTVHHGTTLPTKDINGVSTFNPGKGNTVYDGTHIAKGQTVVIGSTTGKHSVINNLVNSGNLVLGGLMI